MIVIEQFINKAEVGRFRETLQGVPWSDGKQTAMGMSAQVKNNSQAEASHQQVKELANSVLAKMGSNAQLVSASLPNKIFPPCFNRYVEQETYGYHVDAAIMRVPQSQTVLRSDMSMTLFLSEQEEYDGGELTIATDFGQQSVKLNAGDAVVYPSSSLHRVTPVTRGQRLAAICWIQSLIPDQNLRQTLYQLDQTIQSLSAENTVQRAQLDSLHHVYHNLIRQYSQV